MPGRRKPQKIVFWDMVMPHVDWHILRTSDPEHPVLRIYSGEYRIPDLLEHLANNPLDYLAMAEQFEKYDIYDEDDSSLTGMLRLDGWRFISARLNREEVIHAKPQ